MAVETALLQTFLINGGIGVAFLLVAIAVIKRAGLNRMSVTFSLFFILHAIGMFVNVAYRVINEDYWNILLNKVTIYFSVIAFVFLYEFNLLIRFSESEISVRRQVVIFLVYVIVSAGLFLIPDGVWWYHAIPGDSGVPVWRIPFAIYVAVTSQTMFGMTVYTSAKIYQQFTDRDAKKKYIWTIVGVICFDLILLGNVFANALNIPAFRTVFLLLSLVSIILGTTLLYQGVKRQM